MSQQQRQLHFMKSHVKGISSFLVIIIFSLLALRAYFHPGLYSAHDIWHQVARLYHYQKAISEGQFPPYFIANLANGFGYPLFIFSYHLPWLAALPFLKLGFSIPTTTKLLFSLAYIGSGFTMYLFMKKIVDHKSSLLASLLYLWAPYRFVVNYVSATMGVAFVLLFTPLLFLGIINLSKNKKSGIILIALSCAALVLSHLTSSIFVFAIAAIFILLIKKQNTKIFSKNLILALILGFFLSSYYLIPFFGYKNNLRGFDNLYLKNFINLSQLIYSKWGYGLINNSAKEGAISFQLGIAQWIAISMLTIYLLLKRKIDRLSLFLYLSLFACIFLMTDYSLRIWNSINQIVSIDYPTRFMIPLTFVASIFPAVLLDKLKFGKIFVIVCFLAVALYTNRNYTRVNEYQDFPVSLYVESETTTNSFHEYLPKWADITLLSERNNGIVANGDVKMENFHQNSNELSFSLITFNSQLVTLNYFYQPYLHLYVDGNVKSIDKDDRGRVTFWQNVGKSQIVLKFEESASMKLGKVLTIIGLVLIAILFTRQQSIKSK